MSDPNPYWIEKAGNLARLGLDPDFAESMPGTWVALELPRPGAEFLPGDAFGFLTTSKNTYDLRAPVAFRVAAANPRAVENPELARLSPTGDGWLLEIDNRSPQQ